MRKSKDVLFTPLEKLAYIKKYQKHPFHEPGKITSVKKWNERGILRGVPKCSRLRFFLLCNLL